MKLLNTDFNMHNMFKKIKQRMKKVSREPGTIKIKQTNVPKLNSTMIELKNSMNECKR